MKKNFTKTMLKKSGFTLIEIMVALGIIGAGAAVVLYYKNRAEINATSKDMVNAISNMAAKTRTYYASSGSYNGITVAALNGMSLVSTPMSWTGTNITDAWGNNMTVTGNAAGATPTFVLTVGGATSALDKEACTMIATAIGNAADSIRIGGSATPVTTTNGIVAGGNVYKTTAGVISQTNLATGCQETNPVIGLQFH